MSRSNLHRTLLTIVSASLLVSPAFAVEGVNGIRLLHGGQVNGGNTNTNPHPNNNSGPQLGRQFVYGQEAANVNNSFRNGKGWVFATSTDLDANGGRYVKYQVAKDPSQMVLNNNQTEALDVRVERETEWIYDRTGRMPVNSGPADQVFQQADAQLQAHSNGAAPLHTSTQSQMQQLANQIRPTIAAPVPTQPVQPNPPQPTQPQQTRPNVQQGGQTPSMRAGSEALDFFLDTIDAPRPTASQNYQQPTPSRNQPTRTPSRNQPAQSQGLEALELFLP